VHPPPLAGVDVQPDGLALLGLGLASRAGHRRRALTIVRYSKQRREKQQLSFITYRCEHIISSWLVV